MVELNINIKTISFAVISLVLGAIGVFMFFGSLWSGSYIVVGVVSIIVLGVGYLLGRWASKNQPKLFWLWGLFYIIPTLYFIKIIGFGGFDDTAQKLFWYIVPVIQYISCLAGGLSVYLKKKRNK